MATVRDSDISLWLHNKLGTSNDSWTSGSICSQLNPEVLRNIKDCFLDLQTQVKLKLLLSFFNIPRRSLDEWKIELEEILDVATMDSEQWVSMLAEIMKTYPATLTLNTDIGQVVENKRIFSDLISDLRKIVKRQTTSSTESSSFSNSNNNSNMLPLECQYLNKSALSSIVGQQPSVIKHFTLKRKPKSAALRAELVQKSMDAASNLKKSAAPTVPVRSRGMPRKMTDTTPLKGIPSRVPTSGFRSPTLSSSLSRPSIPRINGPAGRKDGGIKLLDITEQPIGYAQAKKRKKQEMEEAKRNELLNSTQVSSVITSSSPPHTSPTNSSQTPDYAAGLNPPTPLYAPPTPSAPSNPDNSNTPSTIQNNISNHNETSTNAIQQSILPTPAPVIQQAPPVIQQTPSTPSSQQNNNNNNNILRSTPQQITIAAPINSNPSTLELTREQMLQAQEMFKNANIVSRTEKALILGFMAGVRENPCPNYGNVVTIKLSENQESVLQADSTYDTMIVETHFQMNYNTGEWKRIKKYKNIDSNQLVALAAAAVQQQQQQQQMMSQQ